MFFGFFFSKNLPHTLGRRSLSVDIISARYASSLFPARYKCCVISFRQAKFRLYRRHEHHLTQDPPYPHQPTPHQSTHTSLPHTPHQPTHTTLPYNSLPTPPYLHLLPRPHYILLLCLANDLLN